MTTKSDYVGELAMTRFDEGVYAPISNPLWDIWSRVHGPERSRFAYSTGLNYREQRAFKNGEWRDLDWRVDGFNLLTETTVRRVVCEHMSFAVPSPEHLDVVARCAPIIEVGAGTGYWAWCLRQMSVDVVATDHHPPQTHPQTKDEAGNVSMHRNHWFACWWTDVERMDAEQAAIRYSDRTLLTVWPYMDDMAFRALRSYRGKRVIFVGEERGATGDERFFARLERRWQLKAELDMPQWWGLHDVMQVWER